MKKIFMILLVIAAFIAMSNFATEAEAADVPEFLDVVGNRATYVGGQQIRDKNGDYNTYSYECDDINVGEDLATEYCNYLITYYPFHFDGGFENDYTRTSAEEFTTALFTYTGSKYSNAFICKDYKRKRQYSCNVAVFTHAQYQIGIMKITIRVATSLIYG